MSAPLLTVAEHSVRLGLDRHGRALRRMLREAEVRHPGQPIGVRGRRRWRLTEQELRRYLPALFGAGLDALEEQLRAHLRQIDQRIERRAEAVCLPLVAAEREAREAGDRQVMASVVEVAARVGRLAAEVEGLRG